ncbi:MAG: AAA family ATPase [Pseudomonadota bacterium]|nr:AAA family ATPase [Pseudomonadota bacterium]
MDITDARYLTRDELNHRLAERQAHLAAVAAELKAELYGIDEVIDRVIDAVRAWYVLPEIITRPPIVCLWGLTGTGKTQLTRLLARKLGFYDRFVEVQMDGFSNGAGWYTPDSLSAMLGESGIAEGQPGILLLDEFQRYRTIDSKGADLKVERYQDVWALLSDGRLSPALAFLAKLEFRLASAQFDAERRAEDSAASADDADATKPAKTPRFQLDAWDARELKNALKLTEPLTEIMAWPPTEVQARVQAFQRDAHRWETDYSRLLIFVTGNLDEMYEHIAQSVEDCDTDADVFHAMSRKLSVIDVKKALAQRFRPEQVARLGNQHVIYPSLPRAAYQRLIAAAAERYAHELHERSGVRLCVQPCVLGEIYDNAVFPAQGTRPVFSTVHAILGGTLVNAALWAIEQGVPPGTVLPVALGDDRRHLRVQWQGTCQALPANFELHGLRQRASPDFRALLAVHEAGHGLVYAVLMGRAPQEVRINVASFNGGYVRVDDEKAWSRRMWLDDICVSLAGRAAEQLVFGPGACTSGAEHDLRRATADATRHVRHLAFGTRLGRTDVSTSSEENLNTDVAPTNAEAEALLQAEMARATALLQTHASAFRRLVTQLLADGHVPAADFAQVTGLPVQPPSDAATATGPEPWHARWLAFARQGEAMTTVG